MPGGRQSSPKLPIVFLLSEREPDIFVKVYVSERVRASICWFFPQKAVVVRAGIGCSQGLHWVFTRMTRGHVPGPSYAAFPRLSGEWGLRWKWSSQHLN